jgi:trehalose/maltose hydrolase-like predicted phosphorylase
MAGITPLMALSPRDCDAVLFDLDGVLTRTAGVHAAAWKRLFDARVDGMDIARLGFKGKPAPDAFLEAENDSANRYKVSKQADVLMLFYLFSAEELGEMFARLDYPYEYETIPRNVAYYASRSSHGSTLSRVTTSWVLARSDRPRSMTFFTEALQSDVSDIQQGTTAEGVHLGAMGGTVDLVKRVSTGIEMRGDVLWLNPQLPREMERLDMRIRYREHSLDLRLTRDALTVRGREGAAAPISLGVDGKVFEFVSGTTRVFRLKPAM